MDQGGTLLAILTNPPITDGERTRARVDVARDLLGYRQFSVSNLFPLPTHSTRQIADIGTHQEIWESARPDLLKQLESCDGVLLAYGLEEPGGQARRWHRDQVGWLLGELSTMSLPAYVMGNGARHPSRWQRWTYRNHPGVPFRDAVRLGLREADTSLMNA